MHILRYISILFLIYSVSTFGQAHQGPETGTVSSGVMVNTDNFTSAPIGNGFPGPERITKQMDYFPETSDYTGDVKKPDDYIYIEDENVNSGNGNGTGLNFELNSFASIQMTNSIPPDPHMAVGPNHVVVTVNSTFSIYDRAGNLLKNINANGWCSQVVANPGAFDPQIIYDHYEGRWFMLWDSQNGGTQTAHFIISYSDDDNPIGTWYMYALDATVNGSIPSNPADWGDYPQIGYDDQGIYISSRQFRFSGGTYGGMKIRILDKSELYAADGGALTFTDFWNIRLLNGQSTDDLHPTISYDAGNNTAYFVIVPNSGIYYYLYKITNPITSPVLTGIRQQVPPFGTAPPAQQLDGGQPLDTGQGGSGMRNAPIIRDDSLYAVHHIANGSYGSIKYFVMDINTNAVIHQMELGAQGFYYIYPAIAVDQDHNIAITYTRSGLTEYAGSYYSTKLVGESELSPSKLMMEGQGNYVVTFGGARNRWGDYLSAALDPAEQYNIWLFSEYAAAKDTWGTWLTEIRMKPFTGIYPFVFPTTTDLGDVEVNTSSEINTVIISNYGEDDLVINSIAAAVGPFTLESTHTFPLTVTTYDSVEVEVMFSPTQAVDYDETMAITSNDPSLTGFQLVGHGYDMLEASSNILYASFGAASNGNVVTVDMQTGTGTLLGSSQFSEVRSLSVNPSTNIMFGLGMEAGAIKIVRVNAGGGDAYELFPTNFSNLTGIAFNSTGTLYACKQTGEIYTFDLATGNSTLVTTANIQLNAIAFHPTTGVLWAAKWKAIGTGKDEVYTVDLSTGTATLVGATGFGVMTNDLAFNAADILYGIIGAQNGVGSLITINTSDGTGTLVGETGFNNITGLGYSLNGPPAGVNDDAVVTPKEFALQQNYPNPFNPSTSIEYSLPVNSNVTLTIYNLLGQVVTTLVNEDKPAGAYSVAFKATSLPSGIYFYKLEAGNFVETKKMVLLK